MRDKTHVAVENIKMHLGTESVVKKVKNNKAITLIALVITIIVLLILAGVVISAISGNENAMEKASEAKENTQVSNEKDAIKLAMTSAKIENELGQLTQENFESELNNIGATITTKRGNHYYIRMNSSGRNYRVSEFTDVIQFDLMENPTPVYWRYADNKLYLRSTGHNDSGVEYNDKSIFNYSTATAEELGFELADINEVIIEEPISPSSTASFFKNLQT